MTRFPRDQDLPTASALRMHGINDNESYGHRTCLGETRLSND